MSAQFAPEDFASLSPTYLSFELAVALGMNMKGIPLSSYHSLQDLETLGSGAYLNTQYPYSVYPSSEFNPPSDSHSSSLPSALSSDNLALHEALTGSFLSAQLQSAARPPSPHMHNLLRWPEADNYIPQTVAHTNINPIPAHNISFPVQSIPSQQHTYQHAPSDVTQTGAQPSWSISGSLDPVTGVFQRSTEHPRLRTAQACEKCRIRKAKCSGEHPSCQRCRSRGLLCEYAPERRMRGPNKNKRKSVSSVPDRRSSTPHSDHEQKRRDSVVSLVSTGSSASSGGIDPAYRFPQPSAPPLLTQSSSSLATRTPDQPQSHDVQSFGHARGYSLDIPSSTHHIPEGSIDPLTPQPHQANLLPSLVRRARPPPIHLGDAAFLSGRPIQQPSLTPKHGINLSEDITPIYSAASRRASLPACLLAAQTCASPYSPVALHHNSMGSLAYAGSRSNSASGASLHVPLTPPALPEHLLQAHGELLYADSSEYGALPSHMDIAGGVHDIVGADPEHEFYFGSPISKPSSSFAADRGTYSPHPRNVNDGFVAKMHDMTAETETKLETVAEESVQ